MSGQSPGIFAGQTTGMRVVRPNNLVFYCSTSNAQCQQLDADGDGVVDFNLAVEYGPGIHTRAQSLLPGTWQVLQDSSATPSIPRESATPLAAGQTIGPNPALSAWKSNGELIEAITSAGRLVERGNWATIDSSTLYLGIRQRQGGGWRYGYLQTKRLNRGFPTVISVTAYAVQAVVTATQNPQLAGVAVYPNPVQSVLQVSYPHASHLRVYDALGRLRHNQSLTAGAAQVSVATWASGIYLLRLENASGVYFTHFQKTECALAPAGYDEGKAWAVGARAFGR